MNLDELKRLDPNQIGAWPWPLRAIVLVLVFVAVLVAGYMLVIKDKLVEKDAVVAEETTLRQQLDTKQRRAAALDQYRAQIDEMQRTFGAMLRQLPGQTEVVHVAAAAREQRAASGDDGGHAEHGVHRPPCAAGRRAGACDSSR